ncbi:hypothetical protein EVAR_20787_1 [Eumeta japonica]|uniref:Uncharacterized protein n=1 Tax=Eumeta variegata TaxID=151549 RepID=A0A4C1UDA7_EUMVA|nr:hypothetical protein EVAR_20787_1 [Eumeta japonica]
MIKIKTIPVLGKESDAGLEIGIENKTESELTVKLELKSKTERGSASLTRLSYKKRTLGKYLASCASVPNSLSDNRRRIENLSRPLDGSRHRPNGRVVTSKRVVPRATDGYRTGGQVLLLRSASHPQLRQHVISKALVY